MSLTGGSTGKAEKGREPTAPPAGNSVLLRLE